MICSTVCFCLAILPSFFESQFNIHLGPICWGLVKNLFKDAATVAAAKAGPFKEFYDALVAKGIRAEMARLTLARKMAAITLLVWKEGVRFDAQHLKPPTA